MAEPQEKGTQEKGVQEKGMAFWLRFVIVPLVVALIGAGSIWKSCAAPSSEEMPYSIRLLCGEKGGEVGIEFSGTNLTPKAVGAGIDVPLDFEISYELAKTNGWLGKTLRPTITLDSPMTVTGYVFDASGSKLARLRATSGAATSAKVLQNEGIRFPD